MADKLPNFLFVFANPVGDLVEIKQEIASLRKILTLKKLKDKAIDFDYNNGVVLNDIITSTVGIPGYTAELFHFSGHANEEALLFPEGKKKGPIFVPCLNMPKPILFS